MSRPQWVGFRAAAEGESIELLRRFISSVGSSLEPRRWFFLWHAEGGLHLRIRVRVRDADEEAHVAALIGTCASNLGLNTPIRGESYARAVHGFGDTIESVLAELLHEATSKLALQIIASVYPRSDRGLWVVGACSVWVLATRAIPESDLAEYLERAVTFARRVGRIDGAIDEIGDRDQRVRAVERAASRVERFLTNDRLVRRACHCIARLWARGPHGRFVAVHGIHMFCNELGLSIQREYVVLRVLASSYHQRGMGPAGVRECLTHGDPSPSTPRPRIGC